MRFLLQEEHFPDPFLEFKLPSHINWSIILFTLCWQNTEDVRTEMSMHSRPGLNYLQIPGISTMSSTLVKTKTVKKHVPVTGSDFKHRLTQKWTVMITLIFCTKMRRNAQISLSAFLLALMCHKNKNSIDLKEWAITWGDHILKTQKAWPVGDSAKIPEDTQIRQSSFFRTYIYVRYYFSVWNENFLQCKQKLMPHQMP